MKHRIPFLIAGIAAFALVIMAVITPALAGTIPTISIVSVKTDESVTIRTQNYPANVNFEVRMGKFGTRGVNGVLVDTINSGSGGSFEDTFDIPDSLKGEARIAIRLQGKTGGYFSYNWFYNNPSGSDTGNTPAAPVTPSSRVTPIPPGTIPTISIVAVVRNDNVTIKTNNYPGNTTFDVRMGKFGTRGVNGVLVDTINSGSGGSFEDTFDIPDSLKGENRIAIRLQARTGGYYSYDWFYNDTGSGTTPSTPVVTATPTPTRTPTGAAPSTPTTPTTTTTPTATIPTISIVSVERNESVTIKTNNYPANREFRVRMGKFGTRGVNGILVDTINSGSGGSFTETFNIPNDLRNQARIAIRLESPSGYYSFNWFYNN